MRTLAFSTLVATALAAGAPALAQTVEELTVTGHTYGAQPRSLSETVSYADLDLTRPSDQAALRQRINISADRLCTRLNEAPPSPGNLGHSCQEVAVHDALSQVRLAVADARSESGPAYADNSGYADNGATAAAPAAPAPSSAADYSAPASATVTVTTVTNGPVPDTPQNRARYGAPMSRAGKHSAPSGN